MATRTRNRLAPTKSKRTVSKDGHAKTRAKGSHAKTTHAKTTHAQPSRSKATKAVASKDGQATGHIRAEIRNAKHTPDHMVEKALDYTYNQFKEFEGQRYTGMKIGGRHKWYYDQGVWKEQKMTPDEWTFEFAVKKRRAGKAPKGSGVPVGTEYHWYILAHQNVKKLNANIYSTALSGIKFKVAHKRAHSEKWSVSDKTQKKHIIKFLHEMIEQLEEQAEKEEAK